MKHVGDITKLNGAELTPVDVICGGSPCQDLSVAGKRAGLDGERSGLFMEQIRIIKEMRENDRAIRGADVDIRLLRPRYMVWENVPGALSSPGGKRKGEDFRCVLEEICRVADKTATIPMPKDGKWSTSGCIVGSGEFGVYSVAWRVHDAQFWGKTIRDSNTGDLLALGTPQRRRRIALVADFGGTSAPEILFERKGLSGNTEPGRETGQEVTGVVGADVETAGEVRADNREGEGHKYRDSESGRDSESLTFQERAGKPGGARGSSYNTSGREPCQHSITLISRYETQIGNTQDKLNVMILENHPADSRVKYCEDGIFQTLSSRMGTGGGNVPMIEENAVVRRLTPLECERLQGYPDGWTDIGEWIDSKGKKHKDADSPRYKALGNSIALPFWEWMAHRITEHLVKDGVEHPTMGSLFDGIGGFPLVFTRCGVKPVWASEIEEFPIAVTKIRFPEE